MLDFEVDLSAIKALGDAVERLQDWQEPLAESGALLERRTKERFQDEKDPDGRPWAPLKKATLRRKKTKAILRETSTLVASIRFLPPTKNQVKVVPGVEYGIYPQLGTKYAPARPYLGITAQDVTDIRGIFEDYIAGR